MSLDLSLAGLALAFGGGLVSFLSPCVLPLVPGYVAYVVGSDVAGAAAKPGRGVLLGLWFVLGFSAVFVLFGAGATWLGDALRRWSGEAAVVGGALVVVFGLSAMGLLRLPALMRDWRVHAALRGGTPWGAFLMGLAFAFGRTPCIGPVLGAILALTALAPTADGVALLAAYAAGLGVPFLLAAFYLPPLMRHARRLGRAGRALQVASGAAMCAMGLALMTGNLAAVAGWILQAMPALARLG